MPPSTLCVSLFPNITVQCSLPSSHCGALGLSSGASGALGLSGSPRGTGQGNCWEMNAVVHSDIWCCCYRGRGNASIETSVRGSNQMQCALMAYQFDCSHSLTAHTV